MATSGGARGQDSNLRPWEGQGSARSTPSWQKDEQKTQTDMSQSEKHRRPTNDQCTGEADTSNRKDNAAHKTPRSVPGFAKASDTSRCVWQRRSSGTRVGGPDRPGTGARDSRGGNPGGPGAESPRPAVKAGPPHSAFVCPATLCWPGDLGFWGPEARTDAQRGAGEGQAGPVAPTGTVLPVQVQPDQPDHQAAGPPHMHGAFAPGGRPLGHTGGPEVGLLLAKLGDTGPCRWLTSWAPWDQEPGDPP